MSIGAAIKARRNQLGMTLTELAAQSGRSASFLSQVENGNTGLSVTSLMQIAKGLGVSINYFVDTTEDDSPIRAPEDRHYFSLNGSKTRNARLGSMDENRQLEPMHVIIPPHTEYSDSFGHAGEEFLYVLQGTLTLHIGDKVHHLGPGHSAWHLSGTRHNWGNQGDEEVHVLWVGTPRLF